MPVKRNAPIASWSDGDSIEGFVLLSRKERINLGTAGFALTILIFYFSSVMDKLGRATSLIGLGVLFLVGGWIFERTRRRLVAQLDSRSP